MNFYINILMVDDHPAILRGYELLLELKNYKYKFKTWKATSIDEAYELLNENNVNYFQIIFLDLNLPAATKESIINGEELGLKIKRKNCSKIIVLSSTNNVDKILRVLKNLKPDGFIVKSEITEETLWDCVNSVLENQIYLSKEVLKAQSIHERAEAYDLDIYDLKIIHFLSLGEKMKNMPQHIPFSLPTIERRKRKINSCLGLSGGSDKELLKEAKKKGFI